MQIMVPVITRSSFFAPALKAKTIVLVTRTAIWRSGSVSEVGRKLIIKLTKVETVVSNIPRTVVAFNIRHSIEVVSVRITRTLDQDR